MNGMNEQSRQPVSPGIVYSRHDNAKSESVNTCKHCFFFFLNLVDEHDVTYVRRYSSMTVLVS